MSDNTIRMLQNTLCSYGLIKEVEDYIYVITDEGRHWLNYGSSEDLVMLIHDHIKYIVEWLGELEQKKMKSGNIAYNEVLCILNQMNEDDVDKIPKEVIESLRQNVSDEYIAKYDSSKSLDEQGYQNETLAILAMLNLNYWCNNNEEKARLISKYKQNEIKLENEKKIKYNPDKIFEKTVVQKNESTEIVEYHKEGFFLRILNFIKRKIMKNGGENTKWKLK